MHFFSPVKSSVNSDTFEIYDFFLVERSQNSYIDVKFDGELISDVFIKF